MSPIGPSNPPAVVTVLQHGLQQTPATRDSAKVLTLSPTFNHDDDVDDVLQVTVTTTTGAKVGGVTVTGTWSSRLNDWAAYDVTPTTPTSGTTLGVVSSTSKALKRTPGGGCYFTVKNAVRTGYSLNPTTTKIGQYLW
jgi:hypothetical protein